MVKNFYCQNTKSMVSYDNLNEEFSQNGHFLASKFRV